MKLLLKGLAFASLFLCLAQVQAANFPPAEGSLLMKVQVENADVLLLRVANLQQESTVVKLMDLNGSTYYRQAIKDHNGYAMKVNIAAIPEGRYILSVEQKEERRTQVIYKSEDHILVSQVSDAKNF